MIISIGKYNLIKILIIWNSRTSTIAINDEMNELIFYLNKDEIVNIFLIYMIYVWYVTYN